MKINISSHEGKIDNEALLGVELWMKENKERGNPVWNCPFLCFYFTLPSVLYYHERAW